MIGKAILIGVLGIGVLLGVSQLVKDPGCVKFSSKLSLLEDFCGGMARQMAEDRCSQVSDDPEVIGACMRVVIPAAHSACEGYVNKKELEHQYQSLCR